jgi:hypothetical protein
VLRCTSRLCVECSLYNECHSQYSKKGEQEQRGFQFHTRCAGLKVGLTPDANWEILHASNFISLSELRCRFKRKKQAFIFNGSNFLDKFKILPTNNTQRKRKSRILRKKNPGF